MSVTRKLHSDDDDDDGCQREPKKRRSLVVMKTKLTPCKMSTGFRVPRRNEESFSSGDVGRGIWTRYSYGTRCSSFSLRSAVSGQWCGTHQEQ
jgi:hypothetical protein